MTREEAIKWVDDRMCFGRGTFTKHHPPNIDECWQAGMMAIAALKAEPRKGEWRPITRGEKGYSAGDFRCSVCGKPNKCYTLTDFCPNCGADMRGGGTE